MIENKNTYELWFLGDFCEEGPKNRTTYNNFLVKAFELLRCGKEAGLTVGGVEIFVRNRDHGRRHGDAETVFDMNLADFNKK
tara:strand:+ start:969 stop:1214 length:246 start_codon:yes stop_codon:yes gene_type:complete